MNILVDIQPFKTDPNIAGELLRIVTLEYPVNGLHLIRIVKGATQKLLI